jgi:DNA mismatch repair protein MutS
MAPADTPLMRQWREAKADHADSLLFFRVGDFYELFHDDAEEGARLLGLTLTSRNNGAAAGVPLAGIPAKALDEYLSKLVRLGRRVAICDQVEDPAEAKGIVRREVTEMITPGTVLADSLLMKHRNNFLVALVDAGTDSFGMAALDVSTGEMSAQLVPASELRAELGRLEPSELLLPYSLETSDQLTWAAGPSIPRTLRADWMFDADLSTDALLSFFGVHSLDGFGFQSEDQSLVRVSGALVQYLKEIRPAGVSHLKPPRIRRPGQIMLLDEMTRKNLELIEPLRTGEKGGALLDVLDVTTTPMGGRLLRRWVLEPLIHIEDICVRHGAVEEFVERPDVRRRIRGSLSGITDLERLAGKVGTGRVTPRDLAGL